MIVHSDSGIRFLVAGLLLFGTAIALVVSGILALERKFRAAARVALTTLGIMAMWVLALSAVNFVTPPTIVKVGDSYCADIECIGIDRVGVERKGPQTMYKLDVRIFSDANTAKISLGHQSLLLQDDGRRRFPLIEDPSVLPWDTRLDPGQTIKTTLTFAAPSDAKQLFLTNGPRSEAEGAKPYSAGAKRPPAWVKYAVGPVVAVCFYGFGFEQPMILSQRLLGLHSYVRSP